jgi:hypothetical protein
MKKIVCILGLILAFASNLSAQNEIGGIYFPSLTSINNRANRQDDPIYKADPTIAYGAGLSFSHHMNKTRNHGPIKHGALGSHFSVKKLVMVDLIFTQHHQKWTSIYTLQDNTTRTKEGNKRLNYMKIPILFELVHPINNRFGIAFYGGPQISTLIRAQGGIVYWEYRDSGIYYDLPFESTKYYNRFLVDAVGGINLEYHFKKKNLRWYSPLLGIRADWSITSVENSERIINNYPHYGEINGYDKERKNSHNTSVSLVFGLNYVFHQAEHNRTKF